MKRKIFSSLRRYMAFIAKTLDRLTNYSLGKPIRRFTNINTKNYWDKKLVGYGDFYRDFSYKYILEFLPRDGIFSLLDIGCALGDGVILIKRHFPKAEIEGVDFSKVAIDRAQRKSQEINFFELDIRKEKPPKKYDYILLVHILEHFNNPFHIVDKCLQFVKKALLIQVPYVPNFDNPHLYARGEHRYLFNEKTFSKYKFEILIITEYIESAGYRYINFKLYP